MNQTLNLINAFDEEVENQKNNVKTPSLYQNNFYIDYDEVWFCQCSSEAFIKKTKNPIEMRSFLTIGVLIDQIIYTHFREIYHEFRSVYKYPKIKSHLGGGCASPGWFIDNKSSGNSGWGEIKVDWNSMRNIFQILFFDIKSWFLENNKIEKFENFERLLCTEVDLSFHDSSNEVLFKNMIEKIFKK
jgi:hypothetical protein